jgi:hypothetical protein
MWNSRTIAGTSMLRCADRKTGDFGLKATGSARPANMSTTALRSDTNASGSYVALRSRTLPVTAGRLSARWPGSLAPRQVAQHIGSVQGRILGIGPEKRLHSKSPIGRIGQGQERRAAPPPGSRETSHRPESHQPQVRAGHDRARDDNCSSPPLSGLAHRAPGQTGASTDLHPTAPAPAIGPSEPRPAGTTRVPAEKSSRARRSTSA